MKQHYKVVLLTKIIIITIIITLRLMYSKTIDRLCLFINIHFVFFVFSESVVHFSLRGIAGHVTKKSPPLSASLFLGIQVRICTIAARLRTKYLQQLLFYLLLKLQSMAVDSTPSIECSLVVYKIVTCWPNCVFASVKGSYLTKKYNTNIPLKCLKK